MPLTHVCMWSEHGWTRVTAAEASRLSRGDTVSARSGLFMCDLCGQYVTLTGGQIRDPYFRHSSEEKSKNCPERTFGSSVPYDFNVNTHSLPIRIQNIRQTAFDIEIGFINVPDSLLGRRDSRKIAIACEELAESPFIYSLERLKKNTTTYLYVGNTPASKYIIRYPIKNPELNSYWPETIDGFSREGTLFDGKSGKKLPLDADVVVKHPYYLVTTRYLHSLQHFRNMKIKLVCQARGNIERWNIYEVAATDFSEDPARFFLEHHARLTDHPAELFPVWPEFIEHPYQILHRTSTIWLFSKGEGAQSKVFPPVYINLYALSTSSSILHFSCNDRQQLVSLGRSNVLRYMYLWKDEFNFTQAKKPKAVVRDSKANRYTAGRHDSLPIKGRLFVTLDVDGYVEITDMDGYVIERIDVAAENEAVIEGIRYNTKVQIFCCLDLIWESTFLRQSEKQLNDNALIAKLNSFYGDEIQVAHATGAILEHLDGRDALKEWISKRIRSGVISARAIDLILSELRGK